MGDVEQDRPGRRVGGRVASLAMVAMIALGGAACADSGGPETGADVQELAFTPHDFLGEQVTISAQVFDDAPGNAFWLGADELGANAVLVINTSGTQVDVGQVVQVTGTVELFDIDGFDEAGLFDDNLGFEGDVGVYEPFEERPVLVAERIDFFRPERNR